MNKVIRIGKGQNGNIYCSIQFKDSRLSLTGVEGPRRDGNCQGGCGQINTSMVPEEITPAPGWSLELIQKFLEVWDRWHLNDMRAGSPAQMEEMRKHKFPGYPMDHYAWTLKTLTEAGLNPDGGYRYGSKWLFEEVPEWVLEFLKSLPETDMTPAWV